METSVEKSKRIAVTIAEQMGGLKRLQLFTGARDFMAIPNGLTFRIPGKGFAKQSINVVTVELTPLDEYVMTFSRLRGLKLTEVVKYHGVYCDQLVDLFEEATGLYLTLR